ncbi:MAG: type VI secretion system contractile sheath large subunit [Verrucomicrobia bacterium]|nr:type VI secretion system contractile sheath large subunit [Verrucomicrobiota bacterium]
MSLDFSFRSGSNPERGGGTPPFRITILGDFGGCAPEAEGRRRPDPRPVDCDNFEQEFARMQVTLDLPPGNAGDGGIKLRFQRLDDFHPDRLIDEVEPLARFARLRTRLLNPATAAEAEKESAELLKAGAAPPDPAPAGSTESTEGMLARLLGETAAEQYTASSGGIVDRFIRQVVGPNVPGTPPSPARLVAHAETELSARLRALLHRPEFQALEAAWRGLDFLIRNVSEEVKLYAINCSKAELATAVTAGEEDPAGSAVYKPLEKIRPGIILGLYTFGPQDSAVLAGIARLVRACQSAFVAAASPPLVGCTSFDVQPDPDDWSPGHPDEAEKFGALRRMPVAAHLGLAAPRFLLRQPYGKSSDPIEAFPFEEMPANPDHESYLWGNPALLCGYLLATAAAAEVLDPEFQEGGEVDGLPLHRFTSDGETRVKPCAEAWLNERAAEAILSHGIMPVLSVRGRDAVQLPALQSFSEPPGPLVIRVE